VIPFIGSVKIGEFRMIKKKTLISARHYGKSVTANEYGALVGRVMKIFCNRPWLDNTTNVLKIQNNELKM
jgi:hypothetical protein